MFEFETTYKKKENDSAIAAQKKKWWAVNSQYHRGLKMIFSTIFIFIWFPNYDYSNI